MSNTYAVLDADNKAVNFVLWDGESEYNPGENLTLVPIPEGVSYGFGWVWDGAQFVNPNPAPVEPPANA